MKSKRFHFLFILLVIAGGTSLMAGSSDDLLGKWEERNKQTVVTFSPTNIIISVSGEQEMWQVVGGTNLLTGLQVTHDDQKVEAKAVVKYNEMIFHLGGRMWVLRKSGSQAPDFRGHLINAPLKLPESKN